ncbi:hypothetical protein FVEG_00138 [Fusarium verticillioides 7600]|uniref:Uncharacterized protein n=1 Tax=Gibberella moniliformis (strain M3125 / FGSC 7600) TaxID=334819 RepID=W7LKI5_GIBM7|nr:hypothetical protein FVEG_00138 [Fusarium verticillioides 7600]EWG35959.1 hypothetical protein FVEG_00138 [Fusarium verticillioides 7600]
MLKQRPSGQVRFKHQSPSSKRTTVETDDSSATNEQNSSDESGDWFDDDDDIQPSDSASVSAAPGNPSTSSTTRNTNLPENHKLKDLSQGWSNTGLGGHPLVQHQYTYQGAGSAPTQPQHPNYQPTEGYRPHTMHGNRSYPSYNVNYPAAPKMQDAGMSGNTMETNAYPYQPAKTTNYYNHQPRPSPPPRIPIAPLPPSPLHSMASPQREDPEKLALLAELGRIKSMEANAEALEEQRQSEAKIRKEAEEAFCRRMEEMKLAQEQAKKEIDKARLEAEKAAKERMDMERQAQERRAEEHARNMAEAEKAAVERLRAEREAEEERSKRFNEFAKNLEKEVRLKVEMEKRAELAERDAKAKQSDDLERLAKLKMIQSMDEIVSLTKKRVLSDLVTDGESVGSKDRQGWLIETRNETDAERSVLPIEKGQLSIPRPGTQPRYATVSTVRSASNASVKLQGASPTPSWKPEAPDPWASGSESDDEATPSRAGTGTQQPREANRSSRRSVFERQEQRTYQKGDMPWIDGLVEQVADAVIERLMHSPYKQILTQPHPHTGQYSRRYIRPRPDPLIKAKNPFPSARQFSNVETLGVEEASKYAQGPPPCGPSRRFYKPPKPERLRGQSVTGPTPTPSIDLPLHETQPSHDVPIPIGQRRPATLRSPQPVPPPRLEDWLDSSAKFESQTGCSDVDTVTQDTSRIHDVMADGSDPAWNHTAPWIQDVVSEPDGRNSVQRMVGKLEKYSLNPYLADQEGGANLQKAYKYVFQDA